MMFPAVRQIRDCIQTYSSIGQSRTLIASQIDNKDEPVTYECHVSELSCGCMLEDFEGLIKELLPSILNNIGFQGFSENKDTVQTQNNVRCITTFNEPSSVPTTVSPIRKIKGNSHCNASDIRETKWEKSKLLIFTKGVLFVPYVLTMVLNSMTLPVSALPRDHYNGSELVSESACVPLMSESNSEKTDFRQIECEISTCVDVSKIVFEKFDKRTTGTWMPVFEGVNKTCFHTLDTGNGVYSLVNRNDYTAFYTKHLLYIKPLELRDQGDWRCVVYDKDNRSFESQAVEVNIYVTPEQSRLNIVPNKQDLIVGHAINFACTIDCIHPEPYVIWMIDGVEYSGHIAENKQNVNGLWFMVNTIQFAFKKIGHHVLSCVVKTNTREPWLHKNVDISVEEAASVSDPRNELNIQVNYNSAFTLNCSGSGYKPYITWQHSGMNILANDTRYIIRQQCDGTSCLSFLTAKPVHSQLPCALEGHTEVYTCTVVSGQPYQSNHTSSIMYVNVLYPPSVNELQRNLTPEGYCIAKLSCDVCRGTSSVWKYYGKVVNGSNVVITPEGSLIIYPNIQFGKYTRTVRNSVGEVDCVVYLHDIGQICHPTEHSPPSIANLLSIIVSLIFLGSAFCLWRQAKKEKDHNLQAKIGDGICEEANNCLTECNTKCETEMAPHD